MTFPNIDLLRPIQRDRFTLIAGPCAIENEETPLQVAETLVSICSKLGVPLIFKASYRKANRSRSDSFTGIGDDRALAVLEHIRQVLQIPVLTDIHTEKEAAWAAEVVDVLQIPAFLCRQTSLLEAAGKTGKCVNIKKGQFLSADAMKFAVEKVRGVGNDQIMVTERGSTFGYQDLVVDFRGLPIMQEFAPVVLDCTHSLQRPNQSSGITGGQPNLVATIARAGVAAGVDGLFIETHPAPEKALSDGANMLPLDQMEGLLRVAVAIKKAVTH